MTSRVLVPLADGFEELEAVTIIDVLRRAGLEVVVADLGSLDGARRATGSHAITLATDASIDAFAGAEARAGVAALVLPGGMPGAATLRDDARVGELVRALEQGGQLVAAICAAPIALAAAGVLEGRPATSYPAFQDQLAGAAVQSEARVVVDGQLVTSQGPGTALDFALALVAKLVDQAKADELAAAMLVAH